MDEHQPNLTDERPPIFMDGYRSLSPAHDSEGQNGLRLLSLDGGGIRGLSELYILREIMQRIQHDQGLAELPRPCDYFDLIGGCGMGGLIALMLGRLRMSVIDAIAHYGTLTKQVFSHTKLFGGDGKFKASKLEEEIKQIAEEEPMLDPRPEGEACKTFVCARSALSLSTPHLFRSYKVRANQTVDCKIWEAARATSAAPTFFKSIVIGGPGTSQPYVDGGLVGNPIMQILEEAELVFPGRPVACVISIGTGKPHTIALPTHSWRRQSLPLDVIGAMLEIATDSERVAQTAAQRFRDRTDIYFRFGVELGTQSVSQEQWESPDEVAAHTHQYMLTPEVNRNLDAAVAAIQGGQKT